MSNTMAVWRTKACDLFGFEPGAYSNAHGVAELFADLHDMAKRACGSGDSVSLDRIFEFASWADAQVAENLRSAADIAFFGPVLRDPQLAAEAKTRLDQTTFTKKAHLATTAG